MEELSKFAGNKSECPYVATKKVVRYLRQEPEKAIIWLSIEPKMTLPVRSIIPKLDMDTRIPGAINTCEDVT